MELSDPQVKAELTASIHAALHRYTYNKADSASLLIDLQHGPAWREEQYHSHVKSCEVNWEDAQTLTGHVNNAVWVNQDYFFVIKFNRPVADSLYLPMGETEKGPLFRYGSDNYSIHYAQRLSLRQSPRQEFPLPSSSWLRLRS